jgi:hypothetical protein
VGITAGFILSDTASSAAVTSNLRLIGSVAGAIYGWMLTELAGGQEMAGTVSLCAFVIRYSAAKPALDDTWISTLHPSPDLHVTHVSVCGRNLMLLHT